MRVLITGSRKGIGGGELYAWLYGYRLQSWGDDLHHEHFHYKCDVAAERDVTK